MALRQRLLTRLVPVLLVAAGLVGLAPALAAAPAAGAAAPSLLPPHPVRNTGLLINPVFSQTLVGGFVQAGNTNLNCAALTNGNPLPAGGCVRNITPAFGVPSALGTGSSGPGSLPFYNNQVITKFLNVATNPGSGGVPGSITTTNSSSATVTVPTGAKVVYAELSWLGSTQLAGNSGITQPPQNGGWDPSIYKDSMMVSVGDDVHFVSVQPDQGTSIEPGQPGSDTNDYYYTASAQVTSLLAGRTGQITLWGADLPFPANGFNMAGLGWNITVVYQYPSVDLTTTPPQVAKQITVQEGFVYQQADAPATNTVVNVPAITDPDQVQVGLIAGEGDAGLTGDTFSIDGVNIAHPVTGQTNNFFVSYAQGATDPNWTSNFSTDDVSWTLAPGIVQAGQTGITLTTTTSGDGYFLAGLNTAIPVPSVGLTKSVAPTYTTVGAPLTYTFTVTNTSGVPIHTLSVTDPLFATPTNPNGGIPACTLAGILAPGASYTCTADYTITVADIARGFIANTATAHALGAADEALSNTASAMTTTSTTLSVSKVGSPKPVHVGDPFAYTIVVTDTGPADAANVSVTDPLPAGLLNPTAMVTQGAAGSTAVISAGRLTATTPLLTHAAPNTFTVTVTGTIASTFTGVSISNTATVEAPNTNCVAGSTDPACSAEDTTPVLQPAPITITKVTSNGTPRPGESFTYTVEVTNTSSTTTATTIVNDTIPPQLVNASWTCAASTGSTCATTGPITGDITGVTVTLLPLGVATFTITATVDPTFQGGTITNEATAAPGKYTVCEENPTATECSAEVPVTSTPDPAPLTITKQQSPTTPVQGGALTYTVVVTNTSAFTIAHATFADPVPAQIDASGTWTTATSSPASTATPASGAGFPAGVALVLAPGESVTFTIPATVAATYNGTEVTNTATATPGLNTACADGQDTCQADVSFTNPAQLEVTKTHSPANPNPVPGQQFTYTATVTNPGNSATGSGTFSDPLPAELDATTATWTCLAAGAGSTCGELSGTGSPGVPTGVPITVGPNGGKVTFTVTVTILPSDTAVTIDNVATVTPGAGTECLDGQPTCDGEDTFTATPETALITIAKSHTPADPTPPAAGQPLTYTVVVTNTSSFTTAHATLDDVVQPPSKVVPGMWTTTTSSPATTATPASGAGFPTAVALVLAPGESVTFTISTTVSDTYDGTQVNNTATATPGTNTACADGQETCQADDSFINPARLEVAKTHSSANPDPVPGQEFTYMVTVTNPGNSATGSGTFSDPLPPELDATTATWNCLAAGAGSTCGELSGTGSPGVPTGVPITVGPNGGKVTFTITVTILPSDTAVTIDNVATVTPGAGTACVNGQPTCEGEDTFTATPQTALLTIQKSQTPPTPAQGEPVTYTVVVTNTNAFTVAHATFDDPVPAQIVPGTWTAAASSPATTATPPSGAGFPAGVALVLAPHDSVTFTILATVAATYDGSEVTNIATADPGLNTACADGQDTCEADVDFSNPARLEVAKSHSPTNPDPVAGQPVTYTVTVTNPGSNATGSGTFSDPLPPELDAAGATWTCAATGTGSTCGQDSGTGPPDGVAITVGPDGGMVTFTIIATILPSGESVTVNNIGSVTPGPGTECVSGDPTCEAEDTVTADPTPAPLTITKSHEPDEPPPTQGQRFTYTITVTNTSDTTDAEGTIDDPFDSPALTGISWKATATAGSSVVPDAGSEAIMAVHVTLPPGGKVTFTVDATVRADWPGGDVINTSIITPGDHTVCDPGLDPSCSATDDFPTPSLISIVKLHEPTSPVPEAGQLVLYRATVTNLSDQQVAHATFDDPLPPQLDRAAARWTAVTTGSGTTATPASGSGPPAAVALTLAPGDSVVFLIAAPILPDAGGTITNTATATPGENTACDPDVCDASTSFDPPIPSAPLAIRKSVTPSGPVAPGDSLTYTVTVTNTGTTTTGHGTVTDAVPAGVLQLVAQHQLIAGSWTATATPGSSVTPTSGSGTISARVTVAPGGHVTFTRIVQVDPTFDSDFNIDNVATLAPGANTHCDPTNSTQGCNANAVVHVNVPVAPVAPPSPLAPPSLPVTG